MTDIAENLSVLKQDIRTRELEYGRAANSVRLLAVSKRQPASAIRDAWEAGQRAFGENFLQEALDKRRELAELDIEWHFIGSIQSNKTADIARAFDWVHTVDRVRIAERLNRQRPAELAPLNVLIQVNISRETTKSGIAPESLGELVHEISALPRLNLVGLMAMPAQVDGLAGQRAPFAQVAALARNCQPALETLSMGTSLDYVAAIAEGASLIRLGTAVFGPRVQGA